MRAFWPLSPLCHCHLNFNSSVLTNHISYLYQNTYVYINYIRHIQLSKFCTLAITIYHYPNLDLMVAIAKTVLNLLQIAKNENNILWKIKILEKKVMVHDNINSDIEQFIEKFDLKIKLVLLLYIFFDCNFIINLVVRKHR